MIGMTENVRSFEKALRESEELQQKFQAEMKRVAETEEAKSEAEAVVRAAGALGYGFTVSDYEKACAETQELDAEEMTAATGGDEGDPAFHTDQWCIADYACALALKHNSDRTSKDEMCAKDYRCVFVYHKGGFMKNKDGTPVR